MSLYRTLIVGRIEQCSALSVGGTPEVETGSDSCFRDGAGRLTIPGTSLAGALIETAARLFPSLVSDQPNSRLLGDQVTGKTTTIPQSKARDDQAEFVQSVWRLRNSHPVTVNGTADVATEWRQGVGIRQATGTTAQNKRALYDFEVVPTGTHWSFLLEIDTHRGGQVAEALAILTLNEWCESRGWLGRSAARGTGWIKLAKDGLTVLRLPKTPDLIEAWPNNSAANLSTLLARLVGAGAVNGDWSELLLESQVVAEERQWAGGQWHYLTIPVTLDVGKPTAADFGWNVLQVAGYPCGDLTANAVTLVGPLSVADGDNWRESKTPDAPFVNTKPRGGSVQPFLPGSGLRGSLRHTTSRLARGEQVAVRDPNWRDDPEAKALRQQLDEKRKQVRHLSDSDVRPLADELTKHFGSEELCGRVLVSDALLTNPNDFQLAQTEHHAEDEFTGGVYGSGKFDKQVLLTGQLQFRIVLEAATLDELQTLAQRLAPALELARLGHLPIGGGKWRGAGWVPWKFGSMQRTHAGESVDEQQDATRISIRSRLTEILPSTT
ncbi:MAG: RAMP superfamily CRISPR-associated protein [Planctomycetaceae bacterium]